MIRWAAPIVAAVSLLALLVGLLRAETESATTAGVSLVFWGLAGLVLTGAAVGAVELTAARRDARDARSRRPRPGRAPRPAARTAAGALSPPTAGAQPAGAGPRPASRASASDRAAVHRGPAVDRPGDVRVAGPGIPLVPAVLTVVGFAMFTVFSGDVRSSASDGVVLADGPGLGRRHRAPDGTRSGPI